MLPELSSGGSGAFVCPIIAIMQPLLIKVEATWRQEGVLLVTYGCCVFLLHASITKHFFFPKARDDAHPVADLLCSLHSFWHCHHSGLQVREAQH